MPKRKIFNPLLDVQNLEVQALVPSTITSSEEISLSAETIQVMCGPPGVEIPARVHVDSRTVTPVLK